VPRTPEENAQLRVFGANVRRERVAKGLTQARLAELVDLSLRHMQEIEAGDTNMLVTTFVRIRRALRCSADQLLPK
jgi:transcriptional regulator with XRE-family HTH domain